jgi:electron transfer flavoprotein alpha subunit
VIGLVIARRGRLTLGSLDVVDAVRECWLIGDQVATVPAPAAVIRRLELGEYAPARWASVLATEVGEHDVVLAASPDGRDLAARLAERLGRELMAGCLEVSAAQATMPVFGGATTVRHDVTGPFVATVQATTRPEPAVGLVAAGESLDSADTHDVVVEAVLEPDLESLDLADARRIVAGGAGLDRPSNFDLLAKVGAALGAAAGATRVITDRGWVPPRRQIGTTGTTVSPELYLAFGISGAVQHTAGLGSPNHIVSVNTDPACPMSQMADLAVVADAAGTLAALLERTGG